jgi:serine/threonine protein kinase
VVAVMTPLMDVVAALHQQGLVHRDLKPSNVFLTTRGVKLLDFGLAKQSERHDALTATLLTSPGAVAGTMRYMAPEQITGDPVDGRADIFALGVLLFEMATGRIPFDAATNIDWLNAVLKEDPPSLGVPALAHLDPIVSCALQRRPQDRYETVERMSAGFREAVDKIQQRSPTPAVQSPAVQAPAPAAAGKALEVDRLVTGSLLRGDDEVRVTAQMVDATNGTVLWSMTTSHRWESAMALQGTVCAEITAEIAEIAEDQSRPVSSSRTRINTIRPSEPLGA